MTKKREYFVSEPSSTANASVIVLHGLGADGKDFMGIVDQLGLPTDHGVRFIFPSAPFINVTINHGMLMRGWYDIFELSMVHREDAEGIKNSQSLIEEFIEHELEQGIVSDRIILVGFSQGGAMALYTALRYKKPLAGVIALSCYLPLAKQITEQDFTNRDIPILMAHGIFDPIVSYKLGQDSHDLLIKHNYNVEWISYPMQHTVCLEEIAAIGSFIQRCLGYA